MGGDEGGAVRVFVFGWASGVAHGLFLLKENDAPCHHPTSKSFFHDIIEILNDMTVAGWDVTATAL
mgnify:CR=1 FL=1